MNVAPTRTEREILRLRREASKGQILVPMLHELLKRPLGIDTEEDAMFLFDLNLKGIERERLRQEGYERDEMVFSPSSLAKCLRKVYLSKQHKKLGLQRVELPSIAAHSYFFEGDFKHLKWQFALYKLNKLFPNFILLDVEFSIMSKHGDHGGTVDALALLDGEPLIIDVKGLNVRGFQKVDSGDVHDEYRIQVADYIMLFNAQRGWPLEEEWKKILGMEKFPKIKRGIILAENKGGPDSTHPAGLTEYVVKADENIPEVRARLEALRRHAEANTIPEIECESTRTIQYQSCPFADYCKREVRAVERARVNDGANFKLASPKRRKR